MQTRILHAGKSKQFLNHLFDFPQQQFHVQNLIESHPRHTAFTRIFSAMIINVTSINQSTEKRQLVRVAILSAIYVQINYKMSYGFVFKKLHVPYLERM